jgi:hypothetical protein
VSTRAKWETTKQDREDEYDPIVLSEVKQHDDSCAALSAVVGLVTETLLTAAFVHGG